MSPRRGIPDSPYLTAEEFAELLQAPVRYIHRLTTERRIRYYKIANKLRFHPDDVADFIEAAKVEAVAKAPVVKTRRGRRRAA